MKKPASFLRNVLIQVVLSAWVGVGVGYADNSKAPAAVPIKDKVSQIVPARSVTEDELPAYIEKISSSLVMKGRAIDPFGQNQDPNYRPPAPEIGKPDAPDTGAPQRVTLSEVVSGIQVSMVMPQKQTFFVGDRAFRRGDRFPLRLGSGEMMNVEILSITSAAITFRETTKGEVAVLRLGGAPAGMQRGTTLGMPPGITVPNPAAPLDLQPAEPPLNSQSR